MMEAGSEGARGGWGGREQGEGVRNRLCEVGWDREWRKGWRVEDGNE